MDNLEVRVHEEISDYKEKFYGLTFRQIVSVVAMLVVDIPFYWLASSFLGEGIAQIGILVLAAPILSIGFISINELPMEKFARYFIRNYMSFYKPIEYKSDRKVNDEKKTYEELGFFDRINYNRLKKRSSEDIAGKKRNAKNKGSVSANIDSNSNTVSNGDKKMKTRKRKKAAGASQKETRADKKLRKKKEKEAKLLAKLEKKAGLSEDFTNPYTDEKPDLNIKLSDVEKNDSSDRNSAFPDSQNEASHENDDEIADEPSTYDLYDIPDDMMNDFL